MARKWNEADGQGRNGALHPGLCREVVVGKPGGRNGVEEGSAQWNESGYSCRGVNPAYELNEQIERPVPVRHERD